MPFEAGSLICNWALGAGKPPSMKLMFLWKGPQKTPSLHHERPWCSCLQPARRCSVGPVCADYLSSDCQPPGWQGLSQLCVNYPVCTFQGHPNLATPPAVKIPVERISLTTLNDLQEESVSQFSFLLFCFVKVLVLLSPLL